MTKINGAMIGSENPKLLGEFYTKVLGQPGYQDDNWYGFMAGSGLMIGAHSDVHGKNAMPARIIIMLEADDVTAEFSRLKELGAGVVAEPYNPNPEQPETFLATVSDPDGNYIQLATPWKM
jgi:predicted enzyme related to lactoylglutathione lyase